MKILAITFHSEFSGGANRSFLMVVQHLKKRYGHEIHVVVPMEGPLVAKLEEAGISHEVYPIPMKNVLLNGSLKDVARKCKANLHAMRIRHIAKQAKAHFAKGQYDMVYVNCAEQIFGGFLAKELGLPCVWHFRGRFSERVYYLHGQGSFFGGDNSRVIVISRSMVEELPKITGIPREKIHLIHNGLEWDAHLPSPQDRTQGIHMVLCGRITRQKGHLDAIRAMGILRQMGYDVYLHLVGDHHKANAAYLQELKDAISCLDLEERVVFEGQIADMASFRQHMNIELMCAECEPFGRVTVEGMRSGLVVIGANTGGTLDIVQDGENGILYQQGDASSLAEAIKRVIEDPALAQHLIQNALEFTKSHFTVEDNVSAIHEVLENTYKEYQKR